MNSNNNKSTVYLRAFILLTVFLLCFTGLFGCGEDSSSSTVSEQKEMLDPSSENSNITSDWQESNESAVASAESSSAEETESVPEPKAETEGSAEESISEEEPFTSSMNSLQTILEDIDNKYHVAVAGNSLTGTILTADLLDWAMTAEITDEQICTVLKAWPLDENPRHGEDIFTNKLMEVNYTLERAKEDIEYTKSMLQSAGNPDTMYPWNEKAFDLASRVMDLSGVKNIKRSSGQESGSSTESDELSSESSAEEENDPLEGGDVTDGTSEISVGYTPSMESLQAAIESVRGIAPSTAGVSMHMAACTIKIMDWAMDAEISDDQIKTVWENWPIDKEYYVYEEIPSFTHQLAIASSCVYNIEEYSSFISTLMSGSEIFENSKYPWNEKAIDLAQHVMDLSGIKEMKQLPEDLTEVSWVVSYQPE